MTCAAYQDRLLDLVYDELDAGARAEVQAHLAVCDGCREAYAGMMGTRRTMALLPEEAPARGDDFVLQAAAREARLRTRGTGRAVRLGRFLLRHPLVVAGATAGLVVFMVVRVAGVDLRTVGDEALPAPPAPAAASAPVGASETEKGWAPAEGREPLETPLPAPASGEATAALETEKRKASRASGSLDAAKPAPPAAADRGPLPAPGTAEPEAASGGLPRAAPETSAEARRGGPARGEADLEGRTAAAHRRDPEAMPLARRARRREVRRARPARDESAAPPAEHAERAKMETSSTPRASANVFEDLPETTAAEEKAAGPARERVGTDDVPLDTLADRDQEGSTESSSALRSAAELAVAGKCANALPRLDAILADLAGADRAEAHYWRCVCLGRTGRTGEARDACALAVAGGAGTPWADRAREVLRALRGTPTAEPASEN